MLGAPCRAGPTHIVQFRPIGPNRISGQLTPKPAEEVDEDHKWPGQHRNCRTREGQDCSTHDAAPTPTGRIGRPLASWSSRPTTRFMEGDHGAEAVKNRYPNGIPAAFLQSAFPEVYLDCAPKCPALSACSFGLPPLHHPRISRQSVWLRVSVRWRIRAAAGDFREIRDQ